MSAPFKDMHTCTYNDVLQCKSVQRLKSILNQFHKIINSKNHDQQHVGSKFSMILNDVKSGYNNTHLLNDFNHVKYGINHHVEEDNQQFEKIYNYMTNNGKTICDPNKCQYVKRYYRDRTKLSNEYFLENDNSNNHEDVVKNKHTINLISKIHVYFIHSYHISRLNLDDMVNIYLQLDTGLDTDAESTDNDLLDEKKMNIIKGIINQKKHLFMSRNNDKYIQENINDNTDTSQEAVLDFAAMHEALKRDEIKVDQKNIQHAFSEYEDEKDKHAFISDIIDAFYIATDGKLPAGNKIVAHRLQCDQLMQNAIYGTILYKYIKKTDLNNDNFVKLAQIAISMEHPQIDVDEFVQIATKSKYNIDGQIFSKNSVTFMKSTQFAKLFSSMKNYKKKDFGQIYVKINKWISMKPKPILTEMKSEEEENKKWVEDEKKSGDNNDKILKQSDIYDLGTRYYYWKLYRQHKHYIQSKHANLKDETLHNKLFKFDIKLWQELEHECKCMLKSDHF
eukprot:218384_1